MKLEQIYTSCLAEAAYYIESNGEAVIIDPLRETSPYIEKATSDNARIKYVLETHFHADFVSGHQDLARKTGAQIVYGPTAQPAFEAHIAFDGEILKIGNVTIEVLHTPGHTMESSSYLLRDEKSEPVAVFTGDTLFIGDVGRPDLAVKSDVSREDLAGMLFESLRNKIMPLPDDIMIYPGHGAGSACGKKMSKETFATLGNQKEMNYALRADMSKDEFVKEVTTGLVDPPQYFPKNAMLNKTGVSSLDDVLKKGLTALDVRQFETIAESTEALMLDVRNREEFAKGFIPGSIFIGLDGSFAPWVGALVSDLNHPILLISNPGDEEEAITRLSRVGYDNTLGYLKDGIKAWTAANRSLDNVENIDPQTFLKQTDSLKDDWVLKDVRKESEFRSQHVVDAQNFPLDLINNNMAMLDPTEKYILYCASGYRSIIAASILKSRGYDHLKNITGGFEELEKIGANLTEYICPTTEL